MKSYSLDFRQKVIETYENEPISQRQLAQRFRVAPSFVTKLLKQYRETGQLAPKARPGRQNAEARAFPGCRALVNEQPDRTFR